MNGHSIHKATPDGGHPTCRFCGRDVKRVPGGQGPTWVHDDSLARGTVAAPDPPVLASADRYATHDPGVEWPSEQYEDPVDAICAALDRLREERPSV